MLSRNRTVFLFLLQIGLLLHSKNKWINLRLNDNKRLFFIRINGLFIEIRFMRLIKAKTLIISLSMRVRTLISFRFDHHR